MVTLGVFQVEQEIHMSPVEAAIREAHEEIGISENQLTAGEIFTDDHGVWAYHTVIAAAHPDLVAHEANDESKEVAWVAFDEVANKVLHPSFANTWPQLLAKLKA